MSPVRKKIFTSFVSSIAAIMLYGFMGSVRADSASQQMLQKVYDLSGLEQQFMYLGHTFTEEGLQMGRNELPDNEMSRQLLEKLEQGLKEKYAPEKLRASVQAVLGRELHAEYMPGIIEVMQGDIWKKAVRLESQANAPEKQGELEQYVSVRLQQKLPRQMRLDTIRELVEKTNAVDTTIDMMVSGTLGAAGIMMGSGQIPEQFEASIREQVGAMRAEYEDMVIRQFLYTYRFMSDEQLKTYVAYYDRPAIQSLNQAVSLALSEALR